MLSCPRRPPEALASRRPSREGGGASPSLSPSLGLGGRCVPSALPESGSTGYSRWALQRGSLFAARPFSVLLPTMDLIGALDLADLAAAFARLPVFPVFDLGYFVVSLLYLKYEKGAVELSRNSPLASWVCAMLYCFGSYILADLLLGESPIDYFSNNSSILLATAVWYLIFYCPLNFFYKCVSFLPVKLIFVAMKEVVRVRKIAAGVHHAHHHYHHGWFIMVIIGFVKGSGVALMSNFEQLLRGVWKPETNEFLHMTFPSKASLYGALLFTLQQTQWLPISKATLIFFFTIFMIICKVFLTATHSHGSPLAPLENVVCPILFGSAFASHDNHHHHHHHYHHGSSQEPSLPSPPPMPAKSREELNEGTRKRKAKKVE